MRIRKNAKLSSLLTSSNASGGEGVLQPHVCQLNQSPWDVTPFSLDPYFYANSLLDGEDSFNETSRLNDSVAAFESSSASMMGMGEAAEYKKPVKMESEFDDAIIDDNGYEYAEEEEKNINKKKKQQQPKKLKKGAGGLSAAKPFCQKNDGKGWRCKNELREGFSLCDYHIFKCHEKAIAGKGSDGITTRRARAAAKKKTAGSNPYEFYYYSGFGPSWGKRRGSNDGQNGNFAAYEDSNTTPSSTVSSPINEPPREEFGLLVDDDDENLDVVDEEISGRVDGGKRRTRKPVKARSLKSLM